MAQRGVDIVLVRRSGPVQTMTFRAWWLHFLWLIIILMLTGMVTGGYVLYRQHQIILALAEDTHLVMLRTERLESLADEQETRELLALQAPPPKSAPDRPAAAKPSEAKSDAKTKAAPEKSAQAAKGQDKVQTAAAGDPATGAPAGSAERTASAEPHASDLVSIREIKKKITGGNLVVNFKVANMRDPSEKAIGYVAILVRGERYGKPWIEAWPPMRLSPLGRPLNYRRGTPFSVQYHRPLKAIFPLGDKKMERLEFLVYSREGDLILVQSESLDIDKRTRNQKESG